MGYPKSPIIASEECSGEPAFGSRPTASNTASAAPFNHLWHSAPLHAFHPIATMILSSQPVGRGHAAADTVMMLPSEFIQILRSTARGIEATLHRAINLIIVVMSILFAVGLGLAAEHMDNPQFTIGHLAISDASSELSGGPTGGIKKIVVSFLPEVSLALSVIPCCAIGAMLRQHIDFGRFRAKDISVGLIAGFIIWIGLKSMSQSALAVAGSKTFTWMTLSSITGIFVDTAYRTLKKLIQGLSNRVAPPASADTGEADVPPS